MRMIDPIEAVLVLISEESAVKNLADNRCAVQHRFALDDNAAGDAWATPSKAVTVTSATDVADNSSPDHPVFRGKVSLITFGESALEARALWNAVEVAVAPQHRRVASTSNGSALVYALFMDSAPTVGFDQELNIDYLVGTASYQVFQYALEDV